MKSNGEGTIEIGVVPMADRWVMFRPGITPTTEVRQVPNALSITSV